MLAPACGSGKSGTPCERTQLEKATSREVVDPVAVEELAVPPAFEETELSTGGPPLHAAASRARAAVAIIAVSVGIGFMAAVLRLAG